MAHEPPTDEIAAQVESLRHHGTGRARLRRWGAALLVVLACLAATAAVPGRWADRHLLDTDRFVAHVAPVIQDEEVRGAVAQRLTDQVVALVDPRRLFEEALPDSGAALAVPLAAVVEGFVRDRVEAFLATERFAAMWEGALRLAHEQAVLVLRGESDVVLAGDGQVTLDLLPVVRAVLASVVDAVPELADRGVEVPEGFGQITVFDDGTLTAAQAALALFERAVVALAAVAVLAAVGAVALSTRRRRTIAQLAAGVVLGMVLLRRVAFTLAEEVVALPPTTGGRRAVEVVVQGVLEPLLTVAGWALVAAAAVAVLAVVLGRTAAGAQARWVAGHRDVLLGAGLAVGLLVLWTAELSWLGLLLVVAGLGAYGLVVARTAATAPLVPD